MTEPKPECCLCDGCPEFADWVQLVTHLAECHNGNSLPGGDLNAHLSTNVSTRKGKISCWCENTTLRGSALSCRFVTPDEFATHLEQRGGLAAHLLELQLGIFSHETEE